MSSCCLLLKIAPLFRSAVTCVGACLLNAADFISVMMASRQVLSLSVLCLFQDNDNKWWSLFWLFSQVIWRPQQHSDPIKTPRPITSLLWYEGMSLGGPRGLMIQHWSHPCWPSGTSDNDKAVLTSTANLLSHVQPIKTWKYKHLSYLNAAIQCGSSSQGKTFSYGLYTSCYCKDYCRYRALKFTKSRIIVLRIFAQYYSDVKWSRLLKNMFYVPRVNTKVAAARILADYHSLQYAKSFKYIHSSEFSFPNWTFRRFILIKLKRWLNDRELAL